MDSPPPDGAPAFPNEMRGLADFQAFHRWLDQEKGFREDLHFLLVLLVGEVGEVAEVLKRVRRDARLSPTPADAAPAEAAALAARRDELGSELADCLAYLLKLANFAAIDLHAAYVEKMRRNLARSWNAPQPGPGG